MEQRIAAMLIVFAVGFVSGKLHNMRIRERQIRRESLKLRKEIDKERKWMRSSLEDEILIKLGLGGCSTISEAAEAIERLTAGKPLEYPPPYPSGRTREQ